MTDIVTQEAVEAAMKALSAHPGDWLAYSVAIEAAAPHIERAVIRRLIERAEQHANRADILKEEMNEFGIEGHLAFHNADGETLSIGRQVASWLREQIGEDE